MKQLLARSLPFLFLTVLVVLLSAAAPGFASVGNIGDVPIESRRPRSRHSS